MTFIITRLDDPAQFDPFVICDDCGEQLCTVEEGDSIEVLVSVTTDHQCPATQD